MSEGTISSRAAVRAGSGGDRPEGAQKSGFWRDLGSAPNLVSLSRVVFIYISVGLFVYSRFRLGLAIGVLAGLTDYLDGYLARRMKQSTRIGALIDQAADILFITGCILMFVVDGTWPPILLYVVLFRETIVLNLRASAAEMGFALPSILLGKVASNFMFWALALMGLTRTGLVPEPVNTWGRWLSHFGITAGAAMSVVTGAIYLATYVRKYKPLPSGGRPAGDAGRGAPPADVAQRGRAEGAERAAGDDR
jgi:cardiolipin synthase